MDIFPNAADNLILIKKKGRPKALNKEEIEEAQELYFEHLLTVRQIARILGTNHMTIWRAVRADPFRTR